MGIPSWSLKGYNFLFLHGTVCLVTTLLLIMKTGLDFLPIIAFFLGFIFFSLFLIQWQNAKDQDKNMRPDAKRPLVKTYLAVLSRYQCIHIPHQGWLFYRKRWLQHLVVTEMYIVRCVSFVNLLHKPVQMVTGWSKFWHYRNLFSLAFFHCTAMGKFWHSLADCHEYGQDPRVREAKSLIDFRTAASEEASDVNIITYKCCNFWVQLVKSELMKVIKSELLVSIPCWKQAWHWWIFWFLIFVSGKVVLVEYLGEGDRKGSSQN